MPYLTLNAQYDTFITNAYPNSNFGQTNVLNCGTYKTSDEMYRSLLKFNLSSIPSDAIIEKAFLSLYVTKNDFPHINKIVSIHKLLSSFNENTVTYNNQPIFDQLPSSTLNISSQIDTYVQWDVTTLVDEWKLTPLSNYGMVLIGVESDYAFTSFASSDYHDINKQPKMAIQYSTGDGLIQYPPEVITLSSENLYVDSLDIPLGGKIATFGIKNNGPGAICARTQLSPDSVSWIDNTLPYLSPCILGMNDHIILTSDGYMSYVHLRFVHPKNYPVEDSTITIYKTLKD